MNIRKPYSFLSKGAPFLIRPSLIITATGTNQTYLFHFDSLNLE
jgi:hypothetical protein